MFIATENKNDYYVSFNKKNVLLLHPLLKKIMHEEGDKDSSVEEASYYQKKYHLLRTAGYFDSYGAQEARMDRFDRALLDKAFANSTHVVFETTERCNLNCKYCGYGNIYSTFPKRERRDLPFAKAKALLDFLYESWNSSLNESYNKKIIVSFYGGEPLLNFDLMDKIVSYIQEKKLNKNYVDFAITTNGLLLDKYIDFLVKWNFKIFISLDGNAEHNSFRVGINEKESFSVVFSHVQLIKNKYPKYFQNNVFFNSVFHKRSSFIEVKDFFQTNFSKATQFLMLNTFGVVNKDEFNTIYKNPLQTLEEESVCEPALKSTYSPIKQKVFNLLLYGTDSWFPEYNALRFPLKESMLPTGTCIPFQKKIYLNTLGEISPCEKIYPGFIMGEVIEDKVVIHYDQIIDFYNELFDRITSGLCQKCKNVFCQSCIFTMKQKGDTTIRCDKFLQEKEFQGYLKDIIEECEQNPDLIREVATNIRK